MEPVNPEKHQKQISSPKDSVFTPEFVQNKRGSE